MVGLLGEHGDDAKPLAGGQSLVPLLAMRLTRFEHIVDLNRVDELFGVTADNGSVRIGAMTRQAAVETDAAVAERVPPAALGHPPHRPLPDTQPGHHRRLGGPRRPGVGVTPR